MLEIPLAGDSGAFCCLFLTHIRMPRATSPLTARAPKATPTIAPALPEASTLVDVSGPLLLSVAVLLLVTAGLEAFPAGLVLDVVVTACLVVLVSVVMFCVVLVSSGKHFHVELFLASS